VKTTTDELRRALSDRAQTIAVPEAAPVGVLRQRVLAARLRATTTVAAALLLLTGVVAAARTTAPEPSTVDSRLGAPASAPTSTTEATTDSTAPRTNQPAATAAGARPAAGVPTSTTVTVPRNAGPIQTSNSPPTTRAAGEPTYAVAQVGTWRIRVRGEEEGAGGSVLGSTGPRSTSAELTYRTRPPEGRTQETQDGGMSRPMTVGGGVRTLADSVVLRELQLWGGIDTRRTFRMPEGAFEVPARKDWGRAWRYDVTSTDGTTHLAVTAKVDGEDLVWLDDGYNTTVETVKVDWVIEVSGDRTGRIQRTVWWATDLGVAAKVHEVETSTTSKGEAYRKDVTAQIMEATAGPESLNRQAAPDEDGDGVPDSADTP
jgi:hypothetical protein